MFETTNQPIILKKSLVTIGTEITCVSVNDSGSGGVAIPVLGRHRILNWRYLPYIRPIYIYIYICEGISQQNMILYGTVPPY